MSNGSTTDGRRSGLEHHLLLRLRVLAELFLMSQMQLFTKGQIGLLLRAIYTGKTLFLLGIKEPFRKKPHL